jgi:hypothetical protein
MCRRKAGKGEKMRQHLMKAAAIALLWYSSSSRQVTVSEDLVQATLRVFPAKPRGGRGV